MDNKQIKKYINQLVEYRDMHFNNATWPTIEDRDEFAESTNALLDAIDHIEDDKYIRLLADFDNYKKRMQRYCNDIENDSCSKMLKKILPALDGLERIANSIDASDCSPVEQGIALAYKNILSQLNSIGCSKIECQAGDEFNYDMHDAISVIPTTEMKPNHIVDIASSGWNFNGKTLIPAKVVVSMEN